MAASDCLGHALVLLLLLSEATALPRAVPRPAVPVQISTTTDNQVFIVMRDNLVFLPPDPYFYVARQQWRESISSTTTYVSLQIYNPYTAGASLNSASPRQFITRNGGTQPRNFTENDAFAAYATESRLFQVKRCAWVGEYGAVTFYSTHGGVTSMLTAELDPNEQLVQIGHQISDETLFCASSNLNIQAFPIATAAYGPPHPTLAGRRRRDILRPHQAVVQLIADYGEEQFVVGVQKSTSGDRSELVILPHNKKLCTIATRFYYSGYAEVHVNATDGRTTFTDAFTLQHAASRLYITTDVMDNMALNITGTGLIMSELEFEPDISDAPDYRYFTRYDGEASSFWRSSDVPANISSGYYSRSIHIFCSLYHRRYCLQPARSGPLRLVAVSPNDTSPFPTLEKPLSGFSNFLRRLNGNSIIPTFKFVRLT